MTTQQLNERTETIEKVKMQISPLESIVREYKKASQDRDNASSRNDLPAVYRHNDSLTCLSERLSREMEKTGVSLETVKKMLWS